MNLKRIAVVSVTLNLAGVLFFVGKRYIFQHHMKEERKEHSYLDNPQYIEQVSIQGAYNKPANIVMLGNSHVFKARWDELLNRSDVAVRGIGSDVTAGYLHRIDQVLRVHPRICFIEGGANDLWYYKPVDSIILNLGRLVDTLKAAGITPVLHQLPPFARSEPTAVDYNARVRDLNARIRQLADRKGCYCMDLYSLLQEDGYLARTYAQPDGVHLTGEGYEAWARQINFFLRNISSIFH